MELSQVFALPVGYVRRPCISIHRYLQVQQIGFQRLCHVRPATCK